MTNVCKCGVCGAKKVVKSRQRFFRCCGVLHNVSKCVLGSGSKRYEITHKVPTEEYVEVIDE